MASATRFLHNIASQTNTTILEYASAFSSNPARIRRQIAEYTDVRFRTANLIVTALLRPHEAKDPATLGTAVFDNALATAMSLSGEIAQLYRDTMDSHVRPTSHVFPYSTVVSGILSVRSADESPRARHDSITAFPAATTPVLQLPSHETPVIWQWAAPGCPDFPAMYRDARTPAETAAVNRTDHAFVRAL